MSNCHYSDRLLDPSPNRNPALQHTHEDNLVGAFDLRREAGGTFRVTDGTVVYRLE